MPKRVIHWVNRNPGVTSIIMAALIMVAGLIAFQKQNDADARHRARDLAAANREVCEHAVIAVTNQINSNLLKITSSFTVEGKPKPTWAYQLEFIIQNEQPPTAACIPKENP